MIKSNRTTALALDEVREHFEHWRNTRDKRRKIPESLWDEVRMLADHYPAGQIAKALRLNSAQISAAVSTRSDFTFVAAHTEDQLSASAVETIINDETCTIEVCHRNGGRLKITGLPILSVGSIISQFMG
jgi:hypothetical protein